MPNKTLCSSKDIIGILDIGNLYSLTVNETLLKCFVIYWIKWLPLLNVKMLVSEKLNC